MIGLGDIEEKVKQYQTVIINPNAWQVAFVKWVEIVRPTTTYEDGRPKGMVYYIPEMGQFVEYQGGVYVPILKDVLIREAFEWLRLNNLTVSQSKVNELVFFLENMLSKSLSLFDKYDEKDPIINIKNGLYHIKLGYLEPHRPDYLSLIQLPVELKEDPPINEEDRERKLRWLEKKIPCWMSMKQYYPEGMDILERFVQAIIYNDRWIKLALFLVGSTNTGKSTVLSVLDRIFKPVACYQSIHKLGDTWGLMPLLGNRVVFDTDSSMGSFNNASLQLFKEIVGDPDKPVPVRIPYKGMFSTYLNVFFIIASNQLPRLASNVDRLAFAKRIIVVIFDHIFEDNPEFEQQIVQEADYIFTYLCFKPYKRLQRENFKEYIKNMLEIWDFWSDPILQLLKEEVEKYDPKKDGIPQYLPYKVVIPYLLSLIERKGVKTSVRTEQQLLYSLRLLGMQEIKFQRNNERFRFLEGIVLKSIPKSFSWFELANKKLRKMTQKLKIKKTEVPLSSLLKELTVDEIHGLNSELDSLLNY